MPELMQTTIHGKESLGGMGVSKSSSSGHRLNVIKLEQHYVRQNLSEDLNSNLDQLSFGTNGAEEDWVAFRDVVYNTTIAHLDQNTRKHQDWFDDNDEDIQELLDEKREAFRSFQQDTTSASKKAAHNSIKSKVQAKLKRDSVPEKLMRREGFKPRPLPSKIEANQSKALASIPIDWRLSRSFAWDTVLRATDRSNIISCLLPTI
ncbi:hypothetical protein NDU88_001988 [Pleurodeles waltl]|uniref:Uncharacterized protein n=1 Tax=Pleurodeles waltl TaxID=8319 RepID=A0AAV7Q7H2_PLEWA|nr:hypothetical protein NDU88_001988 [Pleurodeles waltl]